MQYWITDPGKFCSDDAASPIMDRDECELAFPVIQAKYPNAKNKISQYGSWPISPKWCFYYFEGNTMYWNGHSTGSRTDISGQICKLEGR